LASNVEVRGETLYRVIDLAMFLDLDVFAISARVAVGWIFCFDLDVQGLLGGQRILR